jgi:hypothetical protein
MMMTLPAFDRHQSMAQFQPLETFRPWAIHACPSAMTI